MDPFRFWQRSIIFSRPDGADLMSKFFIRLRALCQDQRGAVAIEFALIGPAFIALLLGVLQIGVALQSYNAIRNVSADIARDVTVPYPHDNGSVRFRRAAYQL
jgi:Flp pilus assembly protein TadG